MEGTKTEMPSLTEIVKGNTAKFSHYCAGNLYYNIQVGEETYQFPIKTVDAVEVSEEEGDCNPNVCENEGCQCESQKPKQQYTLSEDLGTTNFESEYNAMTLMRWIRKALANEELIRVA